MKKIHFIALGVIAITFFAFFNAYINNSKTTKIANDTNLFINDAVKEESNYQNLPKTLQEDTGKPDNNIAPQASENMPTDEKSITIPNKENTQAVQSNSDNIQKKSPSTKKITVGSTLEEVLSILGEPKSIERGRPGYYDTYYYSTITLCLFEKEGVSRVIGWYNCAEPRIVLAEKITNAPPITFGSTMEDVSRAMGTPVDFDLQYYRNSKSPTWFTYSLSPPGLFKSFVFFDLNFKVIGWSNYGNLKVYTGPKDPNLPPVALGSTITEVLKTMGTPKHAGIDLVDCVTNSLTYDNEDSFLLSTNGKVIGWRNRDKNLKVTLGAKDPSAPPITIGSTIQEIAAAMGTPDVLSPWYDRPEILTYGNSTITLNSRTGKVIAWDNKGNLKISMGSIDPNAPPIRKGSSIEEVIKAMGTPDRIYMVNYHYGESVIRFTADGFVESYMDKGNLKVEK